jgi:hypothetical protein
LILPRSRWLLIVLEFILHGIGHVFSMNGDRTLTFEPLGRSRFDLISGQMSKGSVIEILTILSFEILFTKNFDANVCFAVRQSNFQIQKEDGVYPHA